MLSETKLATKSFRLQKLILACFTSKVQFRLLKSSLFQENGFPVNLERELKQQKKYVAFANYQNIHKKYDLDDSMASLNSKHPSSELKRRVAGLTEAIYTGNVQQAKEMVAELSHCHLKLIIDLPQDQNKWKSKEKEFQVTVCVEYREATGPKLKLLVRSTDTVADLKRKIWLQNNIHMEAQRWIIGKKLHDDFVTLEKCGVSGEGHTLFLYIITPRTFSPRTAQKSESKYDEYRNVEAEFGARSPMAMSDVMSYGEQGKGLNMLLMNSPNKNSTSTGEPRPSAVIDPIGQSSPKQQPPPIPEREPVQDDIADSEQTSKVAMDPLSRVIPPPSAMEKIKTTPAWQCPECTFFNLPTRPGCEVCATSRPEDYVVPKNYQMTDREVAMTVYQEELERMTRQDHAIALNRNFQQWLLLDDLDLIQNTDNFTCPICFDDFEPGEGIMLRECLHQFCKDCLQGAVTHSEEAILNCPYQDDVSTCDSVLQEREIRALVPEDVFIKFLQRGLDQAESQAANSFHCKSTDCKGWCYYEDEVNFFKCPICNKENCLTCKVIHEGMNCKEYQANLAAKAVNDQDARKTHNLIQDMVNKGEAMHCPQCKIIVQKKDGCDWLKCSVCKTEICWVTKGPRWGPKGNGDTSAGCRCRINGLCHKECGNCH